MRALAAGAVAVALLGSAAAAKPPPEPPPGPPDPLVAGSSVSAYPDDPPPSGGPNIDKDGWAYVGASIDNGSVMLLKTAPTPDSGYRRVWARYEYVDPQGGIGAPYKSSTSLYEVDCGEIRERTLQITTYQSNNMTGLSSTFTYENPGWQYAGPGTVLESLVAQACHHPTHATARPVAKPSPKPVAKPPAKRSTPAKKRKTP